MSVTLAPPSETIPAGDLNHEEVVVRRGSRSGADMIVAIHSTALGPALGGARIWAYPTPLDGLCDALRLARAMTLKAAAAGLDLGGGKGVLCAPRARLAPELKRAMLLDFGDLVESLGGRYITAEDVGTAAEDVAVIAGRTVHVTGLPLERGGAGDPSPLTALGVQAAIRSCARHRFGSADLDGLRVVVIGLGNVGSRLAVRLANAGAELSVTDIDESKREIAVALMARWVDPADAIGTDCDVLAPCALGGTISDAGVDRLRCSIVCGSANNVLSDEGIADQLEDRGILYAPDFIANAGGLIHVYGEIHDHGRERTRELVRGIERTMDGILDRAEADAVTPLAAARSVASERLRSAPGGDGRFQAPLRTVHARPTSV